MTGKISGPNRSLRNGRKTVLAAFRSGRKPSDTAPAAIRAELEGGLRPPTVRTIGQPQVDAALAGKAVQDALEGWQHLAGADGADEAESRLDRALVYATVERESFVLADVLATLREHGADVDVDRLERSLRRLELAWIVGEEDGAFVYRVPLVPGIDRAGGSIRESVGCRDARLAVTGASPPRSDFR